MCEPVCVRFYQCQPVYVGEIYSACPVLLHYCGGFQEWGISKKFMTDTFIGPYKKKKRGEDGSSLSFPCASVLRAWHGPLKRDLCFTAF